MGVLRVLVLIVLPTAAASTTAVALAESPQAHRFTSPGVVWTSPKVAWVMAPAVVQTEPVRARWYCIPKSQRAGNTGETLCKTVDGGRHWRPVFDPRAATMIPPNSERFLTNFAATSNTDVILSVGWDDLVAPQTLGHVDYWTKDGGKHWYRTAVLQVVQNQVAYLMVGVDAGSKSVYVRGSVDNVGAVLRLDGWPVRQFVQCTGRWKGIPKWPAYPANVCTGLPQDAAMSVERIAR
jgi:hypothetical protein